MRQSRRSNQTGWPLVILALLLLGITWWPGSVQTTLLTPTYPVGLRLSVRYPTRWLWGQPSLITLCIERAAAPTPSLFQSGQSPATREVRKKAVVVSTALSPKQPQPDLSASLATERLRIQTRLEINGALAQPSGTQTMVLGPEGSAVTLAWRLSASTPQPYRGRLWVQVASANATSWAPLAVVPLQGIPIAPAGCSVICLRLVAFSTLALALFLFALLKKR